MKALILTAALLMFSSCEIIDKTLGNENIPVTYISLVDLSDSIEEGNILFYIDNMEKSILPFLDENSKLTILAIDNGSETAASPLYELDMAMMNFENPSHPVSVRKKLAEQAREQYIVDVKATFKEDILNAIASRKKLSGSTDIFGSLKQIERYADGDTRVIIFSDMVNYSSTSNMEKLIKQKRNLEEHLNEVPQIKSKGVVQVYVCTGDNAKMGIQTYNNVKNFWEKYFEANEYKLIEYSSAGLRL